MRKCIDCKHWRRSEVTDSHHYGFCMNEEYTICPVWGTKRGAFNALNVRTDSSLCGMGARGFDALVTDKLGA